MSSHTVIDRTQNGKRSSGNRQKFLKRVKKTVKDQIRKQVIDGSIDDLVDGKGKKIIIPKKDLKQPTFRHGKGGRKNIIHPGNKEFEQGDRFTRPKGGEGGGGGRQASQDGEGEDDFEFNLSHDEFLEFFFEDCELPDMQDTTIVQTDKFEKRRAGHTTDGPAPLLNIERTMRMSKGRRIGLKRKDKKKRLQELEELEILLIGQLAAAEHKGVKTRIKTLKKELETARAEIVVIRRKLKAVPFIDDSDTRYNRWEYIPIPTSQAVMFNLMDVSGSMGEWEKEMAKRFFMLTYLFLSRNYERVEVVWIRHHTTAKEVDEEEFFKSRETGGTQASTAITLQSEIMKDRYSPKEWNIYTCQASDGDNWPNDSQLLVETLTRDILPYIRYYAYVEVDKRKSTSDLWPYYERLAAQFEHFQMVQVDDAAKIYPVFKELFRKR